MTANGLDAYRRCFQREGILGVMLLSMSNADLEELGYDGVDQEIIMYAIDSLIRGKASVLQGADRRSSLNMVRRPAQEADDESADSDATLELDDPNRECDNCFRTGRKLELDMEYPETRNAYCRECWIRFQKKARAKGKKGGGAGKKKATGTKKRVTVKTHIATATAAKTAKPAKTAKAAKTVKEQKRRPAPGASSGRGPGGESSPLSASSGSRRQGEGTSSTAKKSPRAAPQSSNNRFKAAARLVVTANKMQSGKAPPRRPTPAKTKNRDADTSSSSSNNNSGGGSSKISKARDAASALEVEGGAEGGAEGGYSDVPERDTAREATTVRSLSQTPVAYCVQWSAVRVSVSLRVCMCVYMCVCVRDCASTGV